MADTGSRTLRLLSALQARRHWSGEALAERLEVSVRTVRRDVERLRDLGYPVEARPGVEGGYTLAPGAALPPLVLDDEEAAAIAVGLLGAVQSPVTGTADASARALAKLVQVMPERVRRRVDALARSTEAATWGPSRATVDATVLGTAAQACRDAERIEFDYEGLDAQRSGRRVEPHRLVALGQRWYLVAFDNARSDWRTFRVDRMGTVRPTGVRFAPRHVPTTDAASFVRNRIIQVQRPMEVNATVAAPAGEVRDRVGRWCQVEEIDESNARVRIATDSLQWAAFALMMTERPFTVDAPPELTGLLATWGARATRAAAG